MENGDLLRQAEGAFDAFITADKNLRYQQSLAGRRIAILELPTNDWLQLRREFQRFNARWMPSSPATT